MGLERFSRIVGIDGVDRVPDFSDVCIGDAKASFSRSSHSFSEASRSGEHLVCDGSWVLVELMDDGTARVDLKPVRFLNLSAEVGGILETRAERVVYLVSGPGVSYGRFVETFVALKGSAPRTHIGVLSRGLYEVLEEGSETPCDLAWPADELQ